MSDTPETDKEVLKSVEAVVRFGIQGGEVTIEQQLVTANFARKLERDVYEAEREIKDLTIRAQTAEMEAVCFKQKLEDHGPEGHNASNAQVFGIRKERDEALAQMCEALGRLSNIAEDAEAWLNGENDLPSVEIVKAIRDYAKESIK